MKPYGIPPSPLYYEARREEEVSRRKTTAATQPTKSMAALWARQRAAESRLKPPAPGEKLTLTPKSFVLPHREIRTLDDATAQAALLTGDRASRATAKIAETMYLAAVGCRETSSI